MWIVWVVAGLLVLALVVFLLAAIRVASVSDDEAVKRFEETYGAEAHNAKR